MTWMTREDYYYGRACDAWLRKCEKLCAVSTQPSRELSTVDLGYPFAVVRLRNVSGRLGTYRYLREPDGSRAGAGPVAEARLTRKEE